MLPSGAHADPLPVSIGSAESFGVLAGSAVSNTGQTSVTGDLGVSPGNSVSGYPPGTVSGSIHAGDATAADAKADLVDAYNDLAGRSPDATIAQQLGGTTRTPGVYTSSTGAFSLSGTLTLDADDDPDAVFIFKASSLSTAASSNINLVGGAQENNVFWQISGSAMVGMMSTFRGNLLAQSSATVFSAAAVYGRVFALNNMVVTQGTGSPPATRITVPDDPKTTTTLTSSANPSEAGDSVTFTASVEGTLDGETIIPSGEVVFKDYDTVIGSDFHSSTTPATFTTSSLTPGEHRITAVYLGGDTSVFEAIVHFAPSKSRELIQWVAHSLWESNGTPAVANAGDTNAVTLGVKFRPTVSGTVAGVRFYKGSQNTGTHTGSLWTSGGQLLASATFTGESGSGWQEVTFSTPVTVTANTTYVASYHTTSGRYSYTQQYFATQYANDTLIAPADGASGGNGVYTYGGTNTFPASTYQATNYWVDPVFAPAATLWGHTATPAVASHSDANAVTLGVKWRAATTGRVKGIRFYKGSLNTGTHTGSLWTSGGQLLASATFSGESASGWQEVTFSTPVVVNADTTYVASYHTTSGRYSVTTDYFTTAQTRRPLVAPSSGSVGGNGIYTYGGTNTFPSSTYQSANYWVDVVFAPSHSLWAKTAAPDVASGDDGQAVTVGAKFQATKSGTVSGIRFYKGSLNTGTHTGSLWTAGGSLLASAAFGDETAHGWQEVRFNTPVAITAGTTYVISYHTTSGRYAYTSEFFNSQYANGPLVALADGAQGGNGVYTYGGTNTFPSSSFQSTNYWVDPVFHVD